MRAVLEMLRRLEKAVVVTLMLGMSVLYAVNVFVREVVSAHSARVAWIEEACLYFLAWVVFIGMGLALERGRQIAMTSLLGRFTAPLRRGVKLVIDLTGVAFSLYIAKLSLDIMLLVMRSGQISPTLDISTAWLYAAMPVGFVLLALRYALELAAADGRFAARAAEKSH